MSQKIGQIKKSTTVVNDITSIIMLLLLAGVFTFSHKYDTKLTETKFSIAKPDVIDVINLKQEDPKPKPNPSHGFILPIDPDSEGYDDIPDIADDFPIFDDIPDLASKMPDAPIFEDPLDQIIDITVIAEPPQIIGGYQSLSANLIYPPMAKKAAINGRVIIQFIVDKNGNPTQIRILQEKPENMGFGESALKAVSSINFTPGMQGDQPVKVRMTLPVSFKIK